jgi:hypothetical protein
VNVAVQVVLLVKEQTAMPIYTLVAMVMLTLFVAMAVQTVPLVEYPDICKKYL